MSYRFSITAGSIDTLNVFLRNEFNGVSISHESAQTSKARLPPDMAYDTVEDILQFIITASRDIDINLFAYWLTQAAGKSVTKKTTINGKEIPTNQAETAALIVSLIKEQEDEGD